MAKHLGNLKFRVWEKMQEIVQYSEYTVTCVHISADTRLPRYERCKFWGVLGRGQYGVYLDMKAVRKGTVCGLPRYESCECHAGRVLLIMIV